MKPKAVQFGAGNIGRGFLGQLWAESGLEVVFVDVVDPVVEAINLRHEYSISIVGPDRATVPVTGVRAVHGRDRDAVAEEVAGATLVATAVGANALRYVAPALADGLLLRFRRGGGPLNVILCENLHDAAGALRDAVAPLLPESERQSVLERTGFTQAVVSRMVPVQTEEDRAADPLSVRVEAYKRLPIDASALVSDLPPLVGVVPVSNFAALVERKLYTHNCAHAVLGYLGHAAGYLYGYEALRDVRIASLLRAVLDETGQALVRKHGLDAAEHAEHVADLLRRFENEALADTCRRLARDPIRKLAPDDRLVGAARLCEAQKITPSALSWAIAAALRHHDADDPSTCELQNIISEAGIEGALRRVCGIRPGEPLAELIDVALESTRRSLE